MRLSVSVTVLAISLALLVASVAFSPASLLTTTHAGPSSIARQSGSMPPRVPLPGKSLPYAAGATVEAEHSSLTLTSAASLFLFAFATGGAYPSSGFVNGSYDVGTAANGNIVTGLAITDYNSDRFAPGTPYYSIGGVAVGGFAYYGALNYSYVPPVQSTSYFNFTISIPESALVVILDASGGQCCQVLSGVPGMSELAAWNGYGGTGLEIAQAYLNQGTYTLSGSTTNHDSGAPTRDDMVGLFAFAQSSAGFIDHSLSTTSSPSTSGGLSTMDWIVMGVVIAAAVAGAGVALAIRRKKGGGSEQPPTHGTTPPPPS